MYYIDKHKNLCKILLKTIIILLLLYVISFFNINFRDDEGFTMALIHHNFINIIRFDSYDVHPPLYYLVLKLFINVTTFWSHSFIVKIIFARLFSFMSFCISVYLLTRIFKNYGVINISIKIMFILILLYPSVLFFATQIRMYSFGTLLIVLDFYLFQRLDFKWTYSRVFFLFLCIEITSYIHYYYALFIGIFILIMSLLYLRKNIKKSLIYFILDILLVLLYIPWIIYTYPKLINVQSMNTVPLYRRILVFLIELIVFPTGIMDSSLNSLNSILKILILLFAYIVLFYSVYKILTYKNNKIKIFININISIYILIFIIGCISNIFGYEFSLRFVYPSFLILLFTFMVPIINVINNNISIIYNIIEKCVLIIFVLTFLMSIKYNIKNYDSSLKIINDEKVLSSDHKKNVRINIMLNKHKTHFSNQQMLLTHPAFKDTDKATLLLYCHKNMIISHKVIIPISNKSKLEFRIWPNIKHR